MKFLVAATLATSASAAVAPRDLSDVQGVLKSVGTQIAALSKSIQAYNGGSISSQLQAGEALDSAINAGKTQIGTDTLDLTSALSLSGPVGSLASLASPLVSALSAKRATVESVGSCSQVASLVNAVYKDGNALVSSVINLVDPAGRSVATGLAKPLQDALSSASVDYAACKNSGNSGGSGSSSGGSGSSTGGSGGSSTGGSGASSTGAASSGNGGGEGSATPTTTAVEVPTSGASTPTNGGGAATTPGTGVVPTAAAAAFAPAGALALAAAVLAL